MKVQELIVKLSTVDATALVTVTTDQGPTKTIHSINVVTVKSGIVVIVGDSN